VTRKGVAVYEQRIKFDFIGDAPHSARLALVAELAERHPRYFGYAIEHDYAAHRCTLVCLTPGVWNDAWAAVQAAQAEGKVRILSPKER